ncbi:MAG: hypothetical protein Q9226_002932 [Calogaya cf. arnoldii]
MAASDALRGPLGLLRSLIRQLLCVQQFDRAVAEIAYGEKLQYENVAYFLHLFRSLVEHLPEDKILFCIIDGISFYDSSEPSFELEAVVEGLTELTEDCGFGPVFKLLITSPLNNRCATRYFSLADRIMVPDNADAGRILTPGQAMRHTSKLIESHREDPEPTGSNMAESDEEGDYDQGNFSPSEEGPEQQL